MSRGGAWGALLAMVLLAPPGAEAASTFELVNLDGPGEGLNDPAAFAGVGGNGAATLGEARREAVEFALAVWAESLESNVPVRVGVKFDPLGGTESQAPLGFAGPEAVFRDFAGAPRAGTWYPAPLADKLAGYDLGGPGSLDLTAVFNTDVDGATALGPARFYYGFDDAPGAGDVSLVKVALHELAHGLGFTTFVDRASGAKLLGYDDAFLVHLERHGAAPADLPSMSDGERLAAFAAGADLHWTGPVAVGAGASLAGGRGPGGHLDMYGPSPVVPAASLTHFATSLEPDQVLEPFYLTETEIDTGFDLAAAVLSDVGWGGAPECEALTAGAQVLLEEDFDDGDYAGWAIVDYGTNEPSAWAVSGGQLVQSSNIWGAGERGTWAFYDTGFAWTDVRVAVQLRSTDDDRIGVVFRYQDAESFYRFDWAKEASQRRLSKVVGGVHTVLAQDAVAYKTGETYFVEVLAVGDELTVKVDGVAVLSAVDGDLASGSIALSSNANKNSYFDNIRVIGFPDPPAVPILFDDFQDQNFDGWTIATYGTTSGPADWRATQRFLEQRSNLFGDPSALGTIALYEPGAAWTDYHLALQLRSADDDKIGVVLRFQDPQNFYEFSWAAQSPARRRLRRVVEGMETLLIEDAVPYVVNETYFVEIEVVGPHIELWIDGASIFSVEDSSFASGAIAMSSHANAGSHFDNVTVLPPSEEP